MPNNQFDVAVIGLGAVGSATLMHLAKAGVRAVGIDLQDKEPDIDLKPFRMTWNRSGKGAQ